jgi:hypothetical protein
MRIFSYVKLQVEICGTQQDWYKKQGLHTDLTKVPDINHEHLVYFLSICNLAGLLLHPRPSHLHLRSRYIAAQGLHCFDQPQ